MIIGGALLFWAGLLGEEAPLVVIGLLLILGGVFI